MPSAHPYSLVNQDPLMTQIFRKQLTLPNGGIKGYAAPRSGPAIELEMGEMAVGGSRQPAELSVPAKDLAAGLATHPELKPKGTKTPAKKKPLKAASEQLKKIEVQGDGQDWGEARRKPSAGATAGKTENSEIE